MPQTESENHASEHIQKQMYICALSWLSLRIKAHFKFSQPLRERDVRCDCVRILLIGVTETHVSHNTTLVTFVLKLDRILNCLSGRINFLTLKKLIEKHYLFNFFYKLSIYHFFIIVCFSTTSVFTNHNSSSNPIMVHPLD